MQPESLIYTFTSIACHYNVSWGCGIPTEASIAWLQLPTNTIYLSLG